MIPHDAALDAAYGTSAWAPFTQVILTTPTAAGGETQVVAETVEGTLTLSDTNWPRATLEVSVPAGVSAADAIAPTSAYGGRAVVIMGAVVGGARYTFQVHDLDVSEVFLERPTNAWTVRAVSAEARVNEARSYTKKDPDGYQSSLAVILAAGQALQPNTPAMYPSTVTLTTDALYNVGDYTLTGDVWPVLEQIMDNTGGEAYFRYDRRLIIRNTPVIGSPVMTLRVGTGGTITAYRDVKRWAYNAVCVRYTDNANNVGLGIWQNTAGGSPTRVTGPYGTHLYIVDRRSTNLPSQARMDREALAIGKRKAAPFRRLEVDAVPAPWLEPGDTVAVQLVEGSTTNLLVSGVRIPLSQLEPMTLTLHDSGL